MTYYSLKDASKACGYKVRTLRAMISSKKILAVKYPHTNGWFISEDELSKLMEAKNENKD